jgi:Tol biopolymer transport system component
LRAFKSNIFLTFFFPLAVTSPAEGGSMRDPWLRREWWTVVGVLLIGCLGCDASSQGKIAYVKPGSLWVKALPDDKPQEIVSGGAYHTPRWSPSGTWLAYYRGSSQVRLTRPQDHESLVLHQALPITRFAWSPKEDRVAYLASGTLWSITPEKPEPTLLASHKLEDGEIKEFVWGAAGEWLVYSCVVPVSGKKQKFGWKEEVWRISPSGKERDKILETTPDHEAKPGFPQLAGVLSGGTLFLFWQGEEVSVSLLADGAPLYALPFSGQKPRKLSEDMLIFDDFLARSSTGNFLVIVEGAGRETWANKSIVRIDLATSTRSVLTSPETAAVFPTLSPDNEHIAYVAAANCTTTEPCGVSEAETAALPQRKIWVMCNDGSDKRPLTHHPFYRDERPAWSADGTHILFARVDRQGRASLWLMASDGSALALVADALSPADALEPWVGYYGYVRWSDTFDWWQGPRADRPRARLLLLVAGFVVVLSALAGFLLWQRKRQSALHNPQASRPLSTE